MVTRISGLMDAQIGRRLPEVLPNEARHRTDLELYKGMLESGNIHTREHALISIGLLTDHSHDKELVKECVDTIGGVLVADKQYHTTRVMAAYALGLTHSPFALDYLETVLTANPDDKQNKYRLGVRLNAVQSLDMVLTSQLGSSDAEAKHAREEIHKILQYVVEHDTQKIVGRADAVLKKINWGR